MIAADNGQGKINPSSIFLKFRAGVSDETPARKPHPAKIIFFSGSES